MGDHVFNESFAIGICTGVLYLSWLYISWLSPWLQTWVNRHTHTWLTMGWLVILSPTVFSSNGLHADSRSRMRESFVSIVKCFTTFCGWKATNGNVYNIHWTALLCILFSNRGPYFADLYLSLLFGLRRGNTFQVKGSKNLRWLTTVG